MPAQPAPVASGSASIVTGEAPGTAEQRYERGDWIEPLNEADLAWVTAELRPAYVALRENIHSTQQQIWNKLKRRGGPFHELYYLRPSVFKHICSKHYNEALLLANVRANAHGTATGKMTRAEHEARMDTLATQLSVGGCVAKRRA